MLAPFLKLTGTDQFVWGMDQAKDFATIKSMIATNAMSYYLDLNKLCNMYTNASNYQLGAGIIQDGRSISYWSKKLTTLQMNYNTAEKELLAVALCIIDYHNILYSGRLNVFTDHRNITFHTLLAP